MNKEYPRHVRTGYEPFDPLQLTAWTEGIVCKDSMRKYTDFYCTGVYGGISTGYVIGCCLRCIFCWVDFSREYKDFLEEETCDPYPHTIFRLQEAGIKIFKK